MRIARLLSIIPALLFVLALPVSSNAQIGVGVSINIAPPALPVYEQPPLPEVGYMWTPGFWQYGPEGYYWVPGTWVQPPSVGVLWTPGYWGWANGAYAFNEGYWGPQVGFYGGVNYGFGYGGVGFEGGEWRNGAFFYNRSVSNVTNITNVYTKTVVINRTVNVSYNGGAGGITVRPSAEEQKAASDKHSGPTSVQTQHVQAASTNHQLYESVNKGKPAIAATAKPGEFSGKGVVAAKAAAPSYKPVTARAETKGAAPAAAKEAAARPATAAHATELKPAERTAPNTGNPQLDKKYTQQQAKLNTSQAQDRQKLQAKQDQEHQQLTKTKASAPAQAKVEQKHQQQTQQVAQKHAAQDQKLQVKQQPAGAKPAPKPAAKPAPKPVAEKKYPN